jgi:hypothetical protein
MEKIKRSDFERLLELESKDISDYQYYGINNAYILYTNGHRRNFKLVENLY